MPHSNPLIALLVIGFGLAFVLGFVAVKLRASPLVGYLLAGVLIGPFTPGFAADPVLALELAEVGVILLMFGVGLHFSLADLIAVRRTAVPGAILQMLVSVAAGLVLGLLFGLSWGGGLALGLCISIASTVVLTRGFQERRLMEGEAGRIAIGWLVSQDLLTVFVLMLLPLFAPLLGGGGGGTIPGTGHLFLLMAETIAKVSAFVALMLVVGRRIIPLLLHHVAHTGSRELFRLAVLAVALGVAFIAAHLFDVSFALGAFVAGMVLSESQLSLRAAEETLPLRDAFAVLFFISVGMLLDPNIILREPLRLFGMLCVILLVTPGVSLLLLRGLMGRSWMTALTVAAGVAQIGEFSFVLAALALDLHLIGRDIRDLVLAASIISILISPCLLYLLRHYRHRIDRLDGTGPVQEAGADAPSLPRTSLTDHVILVGYGRVGRRLAAELQACGQPVLIIDLADGEGQSQAAGGGARIRGNAADPAVLDAANLAEARLVLVAIPNAFEAGQIVAQAQAARPGVSVIARAHTDEAVTHLAGLGAAFVVMGEEEIARQMLALATPRLTPAARNIDHDRPDEERENAGFDTFR